MRTATRGRTDPPVPSQSEALVSHHRPRRGAGSARSPANRLHMPPPSQDTTAETTATFRVRAADHIGGTDSRRSSPPGRCDPRVGDWSRSTRAVSYSGVVNWLRVSSEPSSHRTNCTAAGPSLVISPASTDRIYASQQVSCLGQRRPVEHRILRHSADATASDVREAARQRLEPGCCHPSTDSALCPRPRKSRCPAVADVANVIFAEHPDGATS